MSWTPSARRYVALAAFAGLVGLGLTTKVPAEAVTCRDGILCAGAASVDMTWHTGSGQGQYGTEGNQITADHFDPFHHQTKMVPSEGMQSRTFAKALVVQGPDGTKVAYAKTELYLQQDVLTRRVAQLVSGADPVVTDFAVPGLEAERIMLGGTHNHSAPMYASTSFGVWLFTDTFDFRMFETTARKIALAIKQADAALVPARVGASVTRFGEVQRNILGPNVADDGTPAGFPHDVFDDELAVIRFDTADGSEAIAAWVNLGMHPESMDTIDLISADFVGMVERLVERRLGREPGASSGPVVTWSQGSVGDVEPDQSGRAHPTSQKREYWHRDVAQAERMSRRVADAVTDTWNDVAESTPDVEAKFVPFSTDAPVSMIDRRFAGPLLHPLPTVSNCRTDHPGIPIAGVPDCERLPDELDVIPEQFGTTLDSLRGAGVPVPSNYAPPSYGGVQESTTIHLQAIRIGEILLATCPCEPISDMTRNFKSRTDAATGDMHLGFEWPCEDRGADGMWCNYQTAAHQPESWRQVDRDAFELMRAQVRNDAAGWEDDIASLQGESESPDTDAIHGNYTHEEIQDLDVGGYRLPIMVGQANDYIGYVVTYREYQRGDHYRKALTAFGPHASDYINTRLVRMAASLKGGPAVTDPATTAPTSPLDDLLNETKTLVIGSGASVALEGYSSVIPDDGGTPGRVITQPKSIERFDGTTFTWEGGSNWTDNPVVVVQRQDPDGSWATVGTQDGGEVVLTLAYESPLSTAPLDWLTGSKVYRWTAHYEAFEEMAPGAYRFVVDGHHRKARTANPYTVTSGSFNVGVWEGIVAHDLAVDVASRTATFKIDGVEATEPAAQLETDDDAVISPSEVHYPDSYTSPFRYVERSYQAIGEHRYCWRCTFRPWADTGDIARARVTVRQSNGAERRYPAHLDGEVWVAEGLDLAKDDVVLVDRGGVVDQYGNINGAPTEVLGPFEGLPDRVVATQLTYTGARSGRVGRKIDVSAKLETTDGTPLEGMTITFSRAGKTATAVTGSDGVAATKLHIAPPGGRSRSIAVRFAGSDPYTAVQITVPFRARPR